MDAQPESPPIKFEVISINCWGLKFISKHRRARLTEIGARLASRSPPPQLVGLQECWTQDDYQSIRQQTSTILPHGKYYHGGIFGAGLAILSRWPIEESSMVGYPLNGRPTAFFRGDWFVGKGVACAKIRFGPGCRDVAEVFCTHLHAPYEREPHDSYICHRTAQAWEIAKLMRGAADKGHLVIGLGDFNMLPFSLAYRLITTHAPVEDIWRVLHPTSSTDHDATAANASTSNSYRESKGGRRAGGVSDKEIPTAAYCLAENGTTCDSALNTWRWDKARQRMLDRGHHVHVPDDTPDPRAKRLDYIFVGYGHWDAGHRQGSSGDCRVEKVKVGLTERHSVLGCSLSDHFSVEASLSVNSPEHDRSNQHQRAYNTNSPFLPPATYDEILSLITTYTARERRQRRLRLSHFILQCHLTIACLVAVWWSPHPYVAFLLMLLATFGFGAGLLDGLIGGLFVGYELRALKEFEWEIRNVKRHAVEASSGAAAASSSTAATVADGVSWKPDESGNDDEHCNDYSVVRNTHKK